MSYNRRTWRMLLTVTTSVVEYSCLHSADNKEHDYYNSGTSGSQPAAPLDDSIHATFSAVHLKWSKDCIIQLARSTCSHELAGSSLVVALKLRNIKVGCPAHVRCNYNFLILLCSSTKIKCHCGDSDGSILQRLIKCCTRLPAEFDGDFGNSNHHFVQFHQNWEMLPTWHFSWTAQDTHSKKVFCAEVIIATRWNGYPYLHKNIESKQLLVNKNIWNIYKMKRSILIMFLAITQGQ